MSEKPIKEWNAVTYLRDFINVWLILTPEEQAVWDYLSREKAEKGEYFTRAAAFRAPRKYRLCQRCGEIKETVFFVGKNKICTECKEREKNENNIRKRVSRDF